MESAGRRRKDMGEEEEDGKEKEEEEEISREKMQYSLAVQPRGPPLKTLAFQKSQILAAHFSRRWSRGANIDA